MSTRRDCQRWTRRTENSSDGNNNAPLLRSLPQPPLLSLTSLDGRPLHRRPLALEDQLDILRHGFVPAKRPAPLPAIRMMMTTTTTMTTIASDGAGIVGRHRCWGGHQQ